MSFRWKEDDSVAIDDLVDAIIDELVNNGGWSKPDSGYDVVRNPTSEFDVYIELDGVNKMFLQFEVGEWNAVSHSMDVAISFGNVLFDSNTGYPVGTETGFLKMSYDDTHAWIWTDYKGNGAAYRRALSYAGKAKTYAADDLVVVGGSTDFKGSYAVPVNDASTTGTIRVLYDISEIATKPTYHSGTIAPVIGFLTGFPRLRIHAPLIDKRYFFLIFLMSDSASPTGGEDAGVRARLYDGYSGGYYDSEAHGQTIEAPDGKEYMYYKQVDNVSYCHMVNSILVRSK